MAIFFLVAGKNKELGRKFLYQDDGSGIYRGADGINYLGGDLFNFSEVNNFKEKIKITKLQESSSIAEADIILKGDSFFNTGFDSVPVPNVLEKNTGKKVFYKATSGREITPLKYLEEINYQTGEEKYFILETVERNSVERARGLASDFKDINNKNVTSVEAPTRLSNLKTKIKQLVFDRVDVEYFIKNNFLFKPINVWFKNQAFNWLGDINSKTPLYLENPKLLFFDSEINFNQDKSKLNSINELADNISQEAKLIKEKYNLIFVYLIIPNKFSIYGDLVVGGKPYDNFIPILQQALDERGVKYVDIYQAFNDYHIKNPTDILFYAGDTHYSPTGKQIVTNAIINSGVFK
jgi:hypothetical protein